MAKIKFKIVTPERTVLHEDVDSLTCPTSTGQITILPGHAPLISNLAYGELIAKVNGQPQYIAVSGGFVEVRPGGEVIILADTAEHAEEIDEDRARAAREKAKAAMSSASTFSKEEYATLAATIEKNFARLKVATKKRKHSGQHGIGSEAVFKE
jgi:F-type H+-transporting ATPase subunit epsilon